MVIPPVKKIEKLLDTGDRRSYQPSEFLICYAHEEGKEV